MSHAVPVCYLRGATARSIRDQGERRRIRRAAGEIRQKEELDRVAHNQARIAVLRAEGLPLPGQSPEQARAVRAMQRR